MCMGQPGPARDRNLAPNLLPPTDWGSKAKKKAAPSSVDEAVKRGDAIMNHRALWARARRGQLAFSFMNYPRIFRKETVKGGPIIINAQGIDDSEGQFTPHDPES